MKTKTYKGSCLCGSVKFTITNLLNEGVCFCHCSQCRKNYGLYGAFVGAPKESLTITGDKNIRWYKSSEKVRRGFCKKCGSALLWKYKESKNIYILAGLIDDLRTRKGFHIFVKDKGDYYQLHDKLPKFKNVPK